MAISYCPDEFAYVKVALLGDHMSQQRIGSDIERDAEKYVRRPLVKLARELAIDDVNLKKRMAGWQPHSIQFADVPGADDQAGGIGIDLDLFDEVAKLVNHTAISRPP